MIIDKKILNPLIYFIYIWIIYLLFRNSSLIYWKDLDIVTIIFLVLIFLLIVISYICSIFLFQFTKVESFTRVKKLYDTKKINRIYLTLLLLSFVYIFLSVIRFYTELSLYDIALSVASSVELREKTMQGSKMSQSILGVLTTIMSGFHIILATYILWKKDFLTKKQFMFGLIVSFIGTTTFLFSGGRNAIFIFILILLITFFYINNFKKEKLLINKYITSLGIIITSIVFLFFFIARDQYLGISFIDRIEMNSINYNIKYNPIVMDLLNTDYEIINTFVFFILQMSFYLCHSLDFLNYALVSELPNGAPYFGALEFYPIVFLLNKIGFDFLTISEINDKLDFAGNYTTLFVPLYYDFSFLGSFFFIAAVVVIFVYNIIKFKNTNNFFCLLTIVLLSLVFILSPIYSFISLGIALPILFASFVTFILFKL